MYLDPDIIEFIAAAAHMANRAYCLGIGDVSQLPWDEAPEWQKASVYNGAKIALVNGAGHTPERSHENWMAQKIAEGWTYGPVKDVAKKEHPCMVPYDQLPEAQRLKDHIFLDTVRQLACVLEAPAIPEAKGERCCTR